MQQAFELFRKVFFGRNFEVNGLNHLSMRVDYYYHLLRHFSLHLLAAAVEQKVDSVYREPFTTALRQFSTLTDTLQVDMILDAFGNVTMFRIQRGGEAVENVADEQLRNLVQQWNFPFVKTAAARSGKCSVVLAIAGWETNYPEMMPVPAEKPPDTK